MENISSKPIDVWVRPWDVEKTDNIYDRDDRFFAILIKGFLSYLNTTMVLNGKPINHFIFNTGSSYLYLEKTGYEYSICETSGEDTIYMKMPRCIVSLGSITTITEELTAPYSRGTYERISSLTNKIETFNADTRRLPLEVSATLQYVLSTTNESLILIQEILDKLVFQKYFNISYLGQRIMCSIEFPTDFKIEFNKIDLSSADAINQKLISLDIKICTNYPLINVKTEISGNTVINSFNASLELEKNNFLTDKIELNN